MSKSVARNLALLCFVAFFCLSSFLLAIPSASGQRSSAPSKVHTGLWHGRIVNYTVVKGRAIYEGDVILGHVDPLPTSGPMPNSVGVAYSSYLWPKVAGVATVYYQIDPSTGDLANINTAIGQFNADFPGLIQWVPWNPLSPQSPTYVYISLTAGSSGECEAEEGYQPTFPQPQAMSGASNCAVGTILHEMGHVIGLWHEHARSDRNSYVSVDYNNVIKGSWSNFEILADNAQNLTLYDYASVMEYPSFSFSRNGGPVIETIPPGIPLGGSEGVPVPTTADYAAADKEGIQRLYGAPPTAVTVTSNPPGLLVKVDGATVTTPQVYSWILNSTHTLDVPTNVQTLTGDITNSTTSATFYYTFGNWNDLGNQSHTVTVTPGNGDVVFPATSPQVATYSANFVQLVPYTPAIYPLSSGTVAASPTPQSYPGESGVFFVARQQAMLTATPASGWNFYEFNNGPFWLPGGLGANPKTFYVPDTGLAVNTTVEFSNTPIYTVDITPETFSSNLQVLWDETTGGYYSYTPKNFSSFYDSSWTPNSQHTLDIGSLQSPFSINSRYAFSSWSDGGIQFHTITLPSSGGANYVATVTPEYSPATNFDYPPCGGSATISPGSPTGDGFYPSGQILQYSASPSTGWTFAGWTFDLTGTTNPDSLTANDETLVFANFNITNVPLTLSSLSPNTAASGGSGFTLTLTGTGFTAGSLVSVNAIYRSFTFVNSTTLTVPVTATDIAIPTAFQVFVENFPSGWTGCAVFGSLPFFVSQGTTTGAPVVKASPTSLSFTAKQAVGTTSASKSVTLKNSGTATATISIHASGDFGENDNCSALGVGASCTLNVTFTPTIVGAVSGAITITDNALNSPQIVSLTGTGEAPIVFSPTTVAFGSVAVGSSSTKTMTLTNDQNKTLNFTYSASGNYTAGGTLTTCGASLGAGLTCTIAVTFAPLATATINGVLTIADDAAFSPQEAVLTGKGTGGSTAPLKFTPASVTFPSQAVGTTSAATSVTVKNTSTSSLTISSVSGSGDFSATGCTGALAASASCTLSITFTPSLSGSIKGAVTIADTASVDQQVFSVSGTAVLPVSFVPTSLTFSAQTVGTTSPAQTITVTNHENTALTLTGLAASGDFSALPGGATPCGGSVAAGASCTFEVTFTPGAKGSIKGAVTVADSASNSPQPLKLTGTGQ